MVALSEYGQPVAVARGYVRLVVDVAGLTFCDLVGVRMLAEARRSAGRAAVAAYVHGTLKCAR